jgi:hypothetical protein
MCRKKDAGQFSSFLLWRLSKAHAWPTTVLVDETRRPRTSKARRCLIVSSSVSEVGPSANSAPRIVATPTDDSRARSERTTASIARETIGNAISHEPFTKHTIEERKQAQALLQRRGIC